MRSNASRSLMTAPSNPEFSFGPVPDSIVSSGERFPSLAGSPVAIPLSGTGGAKPNRVVGCGEHHELDTEFGRPRAARRLAIHRDWREVIDPGELAIL